MDAACPVGAGAAWHADVIIVGAGPAGAAAAYFLSQAGWQVAVLEQAPVLPRYKACGGGLSPRMLARWFPISFDPVVEAAPRAVTYALDGQTVSFPLAADDLRLVMRDRFDAYLLAQTSAEVHTGAQVTAVREAADHVAVETAAGETYTARYLIGADGAHSRVARALGLRRGKTLAAALEAEVPAPPDVRARFASGPWFIVGEVAQGYLWVFPKAQHLSVGLAALHPPAGELQATLRRVMARYGLALEGVPLHGHTIPISVRPERLGTARCLLVGDAAGLADPLTGEGIRLAIKSSRLAAQALLAGRTKGYSAAVQWHIGLSHALGVIAAWVFYRFQRAGFALVARNPAVTTGLLRLLADEVNYMNIIARALGTLPFFAMGEAWRAIRRGFKPIGLRGDTISKRRL